MYAKECALLMDVDQNLLLGEVARIRAGMSGDRETQDFVERQRKAQAQEAAEAIASSQQTSQGGTIRISIGSSIEELEKELTRYLIRYGHMSFELREGNKSFEKNIAQTIVGMMRTEIGFEFQNPTYKTIYNCYVEQMEQLGEGVEVPLSNFINYPSAEVSSTAVDLLTTDDNYAPSKLWSRHEIGIQSEEDRLSEAVPRAIVLYKSKVIELISAQLQAQLANPNLDDDSAIDLTKKIAALNRERSNIAKQVKRLIL
jgi:DNA primase